MSGSETRKYLFVLCTPFTGSWLLHDVVATSSHVSTLPDEGQHLAEAYDIMHGAPLMQGHQWDSSRSFPWEKIKSVWDSYWDEESPIRLEKSPPNLLRARSIEDTFEPAYFLVMIGNPYAFCEGCARRKNHLDTAESAKLWLKCARKQIENVEDRERVYFMTYEEFTTNTEDKVREIEKFIPDLGSLGINTSGTFSTLGRKQDRIWNINNLKKMKLSNKQVKEANSVFEGSWDVLDYFGYEKMSPSFDRRLRRPYALFHTALNRIFRKLNARGLVGHRLTDWLEDRVIKMAARHGNAPESRSS